ncbi:MAG: hypothetical protein ACLRP3_07040 [Escherichia sp.]
MLKWAMAFFACLLRAGVRGMLMGVATNRPGIVHGYRLVLLLML